MSSTLVGNENISQSHKVQEKEKITLCVNFKVILIKIKWQYLSLKLTTNHHVDPTTDKKRS